MQLRLQDLIALRQVLVGRVRSVAVLVKTTKGTAIRLQVERRESFRSAVFLKIYREILPYEERLFSEWYIYVLARRVRAGYQVEESEHHPHRYFVLATAFTLDQVAPCRALTQLAYLFYEFEQLGQRR